MAFTGISFINSSHGLVYGIPILVYPFLTIQRRIECQSQQFKGMLPKRYKGFFSAVWHIYKHEGLKSLYGGFPAYFVATAIWMFSVPSIAQWYMINSPWANQEQRGINFKGDLSGMGKYEDEDSVYDEDLRAASSSRRN